MEKSFLERYGEYAARHPQIVLTIALLITIFLGSNAAGIEIETDFFKSLPQDLPAIQNQNFLAEVFSESDSMFILVELETEKYMEGEIKDIRDPGLMSDIYRLEEMLRSDPQVNSVFGPPDLLVSAFGSIPEDPETVREFFSGRSNFFNSDYSMFLVTINLNGKVEQEEIEKVVEKIENDINGIGFPGSVSLSVTGGPLVGKIVSDLIFEDLYRTLSLAGVIILLTLIIAYRSFLRGIFSLTVLFLAVLWTGGTMVLLDVPLSIVTVVVGSLIVGIGIDYSIHIINRYNEERNLRRDDINKACSEGDYGGCMKTCFICYGVAIDRVGKAIIGTAVTTIASFMALTLSGVPFLSDMGIALSLGIFYSMVLSLFFLPSLLSVRDKIYYRFKDEVRRKLNGRENS
ncbi:MAG: MMPL family transporter [archaeon]|nr:MAG: MMPL family transporter [archaeon]